MEKVRDTKAAYPLWRINPPDERKEGDANELCYISGFDPDRYLHCRSRRTVLYSLREKKIAAHYSH